jgi:phosphoribosylaminoimidazolecarboxamide formyltransferase / IMP cyclohydrolase
MGKSAGNALISVYDKRGIEEFARGLTDLGWTVYASGGTAKRIEDAGVPVTDVSGLVGGQAILGHRVVTLSREVYAGLLADKAKPEDLKELEELNIPIIDLVCVDMYPLEEEIAKPDSTLSSVIEKTDIGGPTMLRAAAKGRRIVLSVQEQRQEVLEWLRANRPDEQPFVERLAARAEYEVTRYVLTSAQYLNGTEMSGSVAFKDSPTKYGENPQQQDAGFYADNRVDADPLGLDQFTHVQGMEKSYVNMTDIDRLLQTVTHIAAGFERNFGSVPALAVGVKHGNACGAGVGETLVEAVKKMLEGDMRAIFGGVVMVNGEIDKDVAEALMKHGMDASASRLLDGVIGASVTDEALELLNRKKLRVIINPALGSLSETSLDSRRRVRPVRGGVLEQPNYTFVQDLSADHMQLFGDINDQQKQDMILAWAIGATSNSNTITLVKGGMLIGNGVGQQDRVGAGQLAITRTTTELPGLKIDKNALSIEIPLDSKKIKGCVAYSDSFFPFPDGPELLADAGVAAILTSSGSVADETVVSALTAKGVSVAMVPDKVGRGFYMH